MTLFKIQPMRGNEKEMCYMLGLRCMRGSATALELVKLRYPKTKQPEKKVKTFEAVLKRLKKAGKVRECGGVWFLKT